MVQNTIADDYTGIEQDLLEKEFIDNDRTAAAFEFGSGGWDYYDNPDEEPDIAVTSREGDSFGNTLDAILFDWGNFENSHVIAVAGRRDDCYTEDWERPPWNIRDAGVFRVTGLSADDREDDLREWLKHEPDHVAREILRCLETERSSMGWTVEEINADTLRFFDPHEHGHVEVEYALDRGM